MTKENSPKLPLARSARRTMLKMLLSLSIFGAGGVCGALAGGAFVHHKIRYHMEHSDKLPDEAIPRLGRILNLRADQKAEFERVFRARYADLDRVRGEVSVAIHDRFNVLEQELSTLLDEAQRDKLQERFEKVRTHFLPPRRAP